MSSSLNFEDSGIDSEDRPTLERAPPRSSSSAKHMEDLEVVFRTGATEELEKARGPTGVAVTSQPQPQRSGSPAAAHQQRMQPPNTCRVLQRKLELKVERARRNYCLQQQQQQPQHQQLQQHPHQAPTEEQSRKVSHTASLIPITRLPVPGGGIIAPMGDAEQKPLVDYKSADSGDDDDGADGEEISFFTAKLKRAQRRQRRAELTDTFSIQEMTIDSELDSDDSDASQNLELLPPMMKLNLWDHVRNCFDCRRGGVDAMDAAAASS